MSEWQPIESAPPELKGARHIAGAHRGSFHTLADGRLAATWHGNDASEKATHWMVLSRPPVSAEDRPGTA